MEPWKRLRPRRGGSGVVDGWGRLRRQGGGFSHLSGTMGDASVLTPYPHRSRPYETSTLLKRPYNIPTPESGVGWGTRLTSWECASSPILLGRAINRAPT